MRPDVQALAVGLLRRFAGGTAEAMGHELALACHTSAGRRVIAT